MNDIESAFYRLVVRQESNRGLDREMIKLFEELVRNMDDFYIQTHNDNVQSNRLFNMPTSDVANQTYEEIINKGERE